MISKTDLRIPHRAPSAHERRPASFCLYYFTTSLTDLSTTLLLYYFTNRPENTPQRPKHALTNGDGRHFVDACRVLSEILTSRCIFPIYSILTATVLLRYYYVTTTLLTPYYYDCLLKSRCIFPIYNIRTTTLLLSVPLRYFYVTATLLLRLSET